MEQIQRVVDALNLRSFANLGDWVAKVDSEVERRLSVRLEKALESWRIALERYGTDSPMMSRARGWCCSGAIFWTGPQGPSVKASEHRHAACASSHSFALQYSHPPPVENDEGISTKDLPKIEPLTLEIFLHNHVMMLNPPPEAAREGLLRQLQRHLNIIIGLPRVEESRYNTGLEGEALRTRTTYWSLLTKLPNAGAELRATYEVINERLGKVCGRPGCFCLAPCGKPFPPLSAPLFGTVRQPFALPAPFVEFKRPDVSIPLCLVIYY